MSSDENPSWLGYIRDEIYLVIYRDYFINHYKEHYYLISIMECHKGLERCSNEHMF